MMFSVTEYLPRVFISDITSFLFSSNFLGLSLLPNNILKAVPEKLITKTY